MFRFDTTSSLAVVVGMMRGRRLVPAAIAMLTVLAAAGPAGAATLHATPATFASTYSAAQGGDTILLANGDYGTWSGGSKSSRVTISPESGASPTINVSLGSNVNNLTLDGFASFGGYLINGAKNVTISNSRFTSGIAIVGATSNILLDHDSFDNLGGATWEGRLSLNQGATGVTVSNSHFGGNSGCSDGVFVGDATGNTIGPGNEFAGILQGSCSSHDDSIQLYSGPHTTITGNYFHNVDTMIMAPDGGTSNVITNNVMVGSGYVPAVQLGTHSGTTFSHNTTVNIEVTMDHKSGQPASSSGVIKDNAFVNGYTNALVSGNCTGCSVDHNLFSSAGNASGTNTLIGTPVFVGGASPSTLAGFAMSPGSPGHAAASDGTDMGAAVGGALPPPTDTTPPDTSISAAPPATTPSTTASFSFTGSDNVAVASYECKLDSGAYAACTSPKTYNGLATGAHTFSVRAIDTSANSDASPAAATWTITVSGPDTTPPDTSITANPAASTTATTASFAFTGTDDIGVASYECKLDGGAFGACTSPGAYSSLAVGAHTFSVRAKDAAGNVDATPATYAWTVTVAGPNTVLVGDQAVEASADSDLAGVAEAFSYTAAVTGTGATLNLYVDGSNAATSILIGVYADSAGHPGTLLGSGTITNPTTGWNATSLSPAPSLSAGTSYWIGVLGVGGQLAYRDVGAGSCSQSNAASGLSALPSVWSPGATWSSCNLSAYVSTAGSTGGDTTPPTTSISSGPAASTTSTSASFAFSGGDNVAVASYECKLDSGAFAACSSPKAYSGLSVGSHTFSVRAIDTSANVDASPATQTWTITAPADTTPPTTSISSGPAASTTSTNASFAFSGADDVAVASYECKLDSGAFAACSSPKAYSGLSVGSHTFSVRAIDTSANVDASPATQTWTITAPADTTPPDTTITSGPTGATNDATPAFAFSSSESGSTFACRVDSGAWASCTSPWTTPTLADGSHSVSVRASDAAANTDASPATRSFSIDTVAPTTTITSSPASLTAGGAVSFTLSDTSATSQCRVDGGAWVACTSPFQVTGLAAGDHSADVRSTDPVGNVESPAATVAWTIAPAPAQTPAPAPAAPVVTDPQTTITVAPAGVTTSRTASFSFTTDASGGLFQCALDGGGWSQCSSPKSYSRVAVGGHTFKVRATDGSGTVDPTPASDTWTVARRSRTASSAVYTFEVLPTTLGASATVQATNASRACASAHMRSGRVAVQLQGVRHRRVGGRTRLTGAMPAFATQNGTVRMRVSVQRRGSWHRVANVNVHVKGGAFALAVRAPSGAATRVSALVPCD